MTPTASPHPAPPAGAPAAPGASTRRRTAGVLAGSLLAGSIVAGLTGLGAGPAQAVDDRRPVEVVQTCDATACLVAWAVVDSDGDGVNDADEWMAGTDPNDPTSYPPLAALVDLLAGRQLPSFENGFASLVALPADLVELQAKATGGGRIDGRWFEGFPVEDRKDTLSGLGISTDLMAEYGIDVGRDGFTLGLEARGRDDQGLPGIRLGSADRSLYSADGGTGTTPTTKPGGATPTTVKSDGGTTPTTTGGTTATTAGPDGAGGAGASGGSGDSGATGGTEDLADLKKQKHGGWYDKKDQGNGITKYYFNDGTVRTATKNGWSDEKNGVTNSVGFWKKYTNPDAEDAARVDPARFEAWERTLNDTKLTVEGATPPVGDELPEDRRTQIAYIDGELGFGLSIVSDAPRITTAQPEVRPDLPSPLDRIPAGSTPMGGSGNDCRNVSCGG